MVIERNRWVRRFLVAQPALIWPLSFVLWSTGDDLALAVAVLLLWISAAVTVAAILRPMHAASTTCERRAAGCPPLAESPRAGRVRG